MSFTIFATLFLFVVPIIVGIFLLRRSKKLAYTIIGIPFVIMIVVIGWSVYMMNHNFVSSTDLAAENIGGISLYDTLDETFKENYGDYEEEDNAYYNESLQFDTFNVGTNQQNQIVYISASDPAMKTGAGIQIGDQIQKVFNTYGENYYTYDEMGLGESVNYVDRDQGFHLQIWHINEEVVSIHLMEN